MITCDSEVKHEPKQSRKLTHCKRRQMHSLQIVPGAPYLDTCRC